MLGLVNDLFPPNRARLIIVHPRLAIRRFFKYAFTRYPIYTIKAKPPTIFCTIRTLTLMHNPTVEANWRSSNFTSGVFFLGGGGFRPVVSFPGVPQSQAASKCPGAGRRCWTAGPTGSGSLSMTAGCSATRGPTGGQGTVSAESSVPLKQALA